MENGKKFGSVSKSTITGIRHTVRNKIRVLYVPTCFVYFWDRSTLNIR